MAWAMARPLRGWGMPLGMGRDGGRDALLQDLESDFRTGDGGIRGRGRGGRPRRPGAGRGLPRPRPCLRGGPGRRGGAAGGGGGRRGGDHRVTTTYRDTTLALLRALARGSTMAEMVEALGISERTIRYHLRRLEDDGGALVRPSGGWGDRKSTRL